MDDHPAALAETPEPPYVAVIFSSERSGVDTDGYEAAAAAMADLAAEQPGYLGVESAHEGIGVTVSYWVDEAAARAWRAVAEHRLVQAEGRRRWYRSYRIRVAVVHRQATFP